MQKIEVLTPPTFPAVATADMVSFLRLYDNYESDLIASFVDAATDLFTQQTGVVLCDQSQRLRLDNWPILKPYSYCGSLLQPKPNVIYIPRAPVTSITSVGYLDPNNTWQTLSGCIYDIVSTPARIILPTGPLPILHDTAAGSVRVTFECGYPDAGSIPSAAALAVKLLAAHWYNTRSAYTDDPLTEVPAGWFALTKRFSLEIGGNWNA
jgi:uncharacterized phiE125 gp8 family phage protein